MQTTDRNSPVPQVTDRATWQESVDELRVKEKAHTRAGDALRPGATALAHGRGRSDHDADQWRRAGPVDRGLRRSSQLLAYFLMWHTGKPAAEQGGT